jgi:hypothetical protein
MEKDLTEKEQQLAECTSAIQRNVLTRQISQLRDRLANDDKVGTRVGEYKEDPSLPSLKGALPITSPLALFCHQHL